jgi:hypothetical protein
VNKKLLYFGGKTNTWLRRYEFGVMITRAHEGAMEAGMKRCRDKNIEIRTVIGIGDLD